MSTTGVKIFGMVVMRLGRLAGILALPLAVVVLCGTLFADGWIVSQPGLRGGSAVALAVLFLVMLVCGSMAEWVRASVLKKRADAMPGWVDRDEVAVVKR